MDPRTDRIVAEVTNQRLASVECALMDFPVRGSGLLNVQDRPAVGAPMHRAWMIHGAEASLPTGREIQHPQRIGRSRDEPVTSPRHERHVSAVRRNRKI